MAARLPKPDAPGRLEIRLRLVPPQMPLGEEVDIEVLSRDFAAAGGAIKNAVMRASLRAWAEGTAMTHELLGVAWAQEHRHTGGPLSRGDAP